MANRPESSHSCESFSLSSRAARVLAGSRWSFHKAAAWAVASTRGRRRHTVTEALTGAVQQAASRAGVKTVDGQRRFRVNRPRTTADAAQPRSTAKPYEIAPALGTRFDIRHSPVGPRPRAFGASTAPGVGLCGAACLSKRRTVTAKSSSVARGAIAHDS
jgi:hypothetical protein